MPVVVVVKLVMVAPMVGIVFWVTVYSFQAEVAAAMFTVPSAKMRLIKTVRVALETWLAVMPVGRVVRSNCTRPVLPPPMSMLASVPKLVPGRRVLVKVSPESGTSVAWAAAGARDTTKSRAVTGATERRTANRRGVKRNRFKASSRGR